MKKNKLILLLMLFLFPISVFASEEASSKFFGGLFFEELMTAPVSMLVLKPIAKFFDSDESKKLF